jgi:hypothetical protein
VGGVIAGVACAALLVLAVKKYLDNKNKGEKKTDTVMNPMF